MEDGNNQHAIRVDLEQLREQIADPDMVITVIVFARTQGPAVYVTSDTEWLANNNDKAVAVFEHAARGLGHVASHLGIATIVTTTEDPTDQLGREDN